MKRNLNAQILNCSNLETKARFELYTFFWCKWTYYMHESDLRWIGFEYLKVWTFLKKKNQKENTTEANGAKGEAGPAICRTQAPHKAGSTGPRPCCVADPVRDPAVNVTGRPVRDSVGLDPENI